MRQRYKRAIPARFDEAELVLSRPNGLILPQAQDTAQDSDKNYTIPDWPKLHPQLAEQFAKLLRRVLVVQNGLYTES